MQRKGKYGRISIVLMLLLSLILLLAGCKEAAPERDEEESSEIIANADGEEASSGLEASENTAQGEHEAVPSTEESQESTAPAATEEVPAAPVVVSAEHYEFSYPGELAELLVVKEAPSAETQGLSFYAKLSVGEVAVFTLYYNSDQGDIVQMVSAEDGTQIPFAFIMNTDTESLNAEELDRFYLAQEAVNHVIQSLTLK